MVLYNLIIIITCAIGNFYAELDLFLNYEPEWDRRILCIIP